MLLLYILLHLKMLSQIMTLPKSKLPRSLHVENWLGLQMSFAAFAHIRGINTPALAISSYQHDITERGVGKR